MSTSHSDHTPPPGERQSAVPTLECKAVAVHYGGVKAVDGISISLATGLISGIIGPNGSGKSTLIAAMTRLAHLTAGELRFDGQPYDEVRPAHIAALGIARTFQTVRLLPDLTVRENVQLGHDAHPAARARRGRSRRLSPVVTEALERTRLTGLGDLYPAELSYGTQRRVEIARAIAMQPKLLLLDEPTAGMNQSERAEISELMRALREEGLTQLLVEHDVQMMLDTCDHLFAMAQGRLLTGGRPRDVVRHPAVQEAYLGKNWRAHAGSD